MLYNIILNFEKIKMKSIIYNSNIKVLLLEDFFSILLNFSLNFSNIHIWISIILFK